MKHSTVSSLVLMYKYKADLQLVQKFERRLKEGRENREGMNDEGNNITRTHREWTCDIITEV